MHCRADSRQVVAVSHLGGRCRCNVTSATVSASANVSSIFRQIESASDAGSRPQRNEHGP